MPVSPFNSKTPSQDEHQFWFNQICSLKPQVIYSILQAAVDYETVSKWMATLPIIKPSKYGKKD